LPLIFAFSQGKTDIIVFGRNEGIVNDGILVLRATNDEMIKGADKCVSKVKWSAFMQRHRRIHCSRSVSKINFDTIGVVFARVIGKF
jgi:hypothetical protein